MQLESSCVFGSRLWYSGQKGFQHSLSFGMGLSCLSILCRFVRANKIHPPWGMRNPKSGAAAIWHRCAFELRKLNSKCLGWIWTSINSREEQSDPPCSCWVKLKSMSWKVLQRLRRASVLSKSLGQSCPEMSSASQCFQGNQSWNSVLMKVHQIRALSDIIFFTVWTGIFGSCFWTVALVCMAMSSTSKGTIGRRYTFLEIRGSSFAFSAVIVPWEHRHHCTAGSMAIWWDHLFLRAFSNADISTGWEQALISLFSWWCNIIPYIK